MDVLFPEQVTDSGYKLEYLEVYNWGGFHENIWRIGPNRNSILVTGANGSGKTTIADALVTLLVPPARRHYNQSSGSERKRDRTEESYVLGAYGSLRNDEAGRSAVSYLRDKSCYSILIAVFHNDLTGSHFTLAQLRWFTSAGMQRDYITADAPLSIRDHFHPLDARREYRKRLSSIPGITWHDSFSKYQQYLIRSLGLRSEKALNLFSQIVGVKQIENLNSFIRTHMIEEPGMEEDFRKLKGNYQDLLQTHNKIEMAEKQLEFLSAIKENGQKYRAVQEEAEKLHTVNEGIPFYFASRIKETAEEIHLRESVSLEKYKEDKDALEQEKNNLDRELESVNAAIAQDSTANRIREIESELRIMQERMQERKRRHSSYVSNSAVLNLPVPSSPQIFNENRAEAASIIKQVQKEVEENETSLRRTERQQEDHNERAAEIEQEITSLQNRRSNIFNKSLGLRKKLCDALAVDPRELPFAGELIQVRNEESRWELAAEKLLHSFALSILVPESLYHRATDYINSTDLKGRLIYYRIPEKRQNDGHGTSNDLFQSRPATLPSKLEVRANTPFSFWLAATLLDRFDYLCTDDLEEFAHTSYAVTSRGLIKGKRKHEKDDRPERWKRDKYVLGWDNSRKIAFLKKEHAGISSMLSELEKKIDTLKREINTLREQAGSAEKIIDFEKYSDINWAESGEKISDLEIQKKSLLESADALKELKNKKDNLQNAQNKLKNINEDLISKITLCNQQIEKMKEQIENSVRLLSELDEPHRSLMEIVTPFIVKLFAERKPEGTDPIEELKNRRNTALQHINAKGEEIRKKVERTGRDLSNAMNRFLRPGMEISTRFTGWASDTLHLSPEPEFLDDFISVHKRIEKDDLPRYKKDFRKFMNDQMFENIIYFSNTLDSTEQKIKEDISNLNRSLKEVNYSRMPETYIILDSRVTRDVSVLDFKALLRSSMGNTGKNGDNELEASFFRIQELITKLSEDDNWRKKVLDVRNWLEFGAIELYRDNDEQKQYYEDSMSLSGGEKAKLAYTILASAISYQYGLNREQHEQSGRSFRFVIVDEIFSKVDPENSEYAMDLFRTMGLQLMIVTPLDRINIVEKHIGSVCFIEKQKEYAVPHHLSMDAYREMQDARS